MTQPGPYRRRTIEDILFGEQPPSGAQSMAEAAAPPPGAASRIVGALGTAGRGALRAGEFLGNRALDVASAAFPPLGVVRYVVPAALEEQQRRREMAPLQRERAQLELEAMRRAAEAQQAQAGALGERIGAATDPREREALIRGRASGEFRPFGIEPGPAELKAYELAGQMTQEEARQALIAQREERQARLSHDLQLAEIGARGRQEIETEREKRALGPGPGSLDDEKAMRAQFEGLGKEFSTVRQAYKLIRSLPDTKVGDLTLLISYMKLTDPGSTVREGELATADNAGGVPGWLRAQYNRLREGEGRLSPEVRQDYLARTEDIYQARLGSHRNLERQYGEIAVRRGFDPRNVITDFVGPDAEPKSGGLSDAEKAELEALEKRFGGR
jgi:hypothetical protein